MLYYSKRQVDLDSIDTLQLDKLKEFKASIIDKGIQENYISVDDLKQKLSRQLTIIMRGMSVGAVVSSKSVQEARKSTEEIGNTDTVDNRTASAAEIRLLDYSDRSFIISGNTLKWKDQLSGLRGKYISLRNGGKAWNFSKKRLPEISRLLGVDAKIEPYE